MKRTLCESVAPLHTLSLAELQAQLERVDDNLKSAYDGPDASYQEFNYIHFLRQDRADLLEEIMTRKGM